VARKAAFHPGVVQKQVDRRVEPHPLTLRPEGATGQEEVAPRW
jgi:hypothetical protein